MLHRPAAQTRLLPTPARPRLRLPAVAVVLAAALAAGTAFRLGWPADIEYKFDESFSFHQARAMVERGQFRPVGMPTSQGLRNPGLSAWVFAPIGLVCGTDSPVQLVRGVAVIALAVLVALTLFACRCVPAGEREAWLWAVALAAVNPVAVMFHRKLWPPCAALGLTFLALVGYWHRGRRWGAFLWGLSAALAGQAHLSGAFLAGGFALWAGLFDRRGTRWGWAVLGAGLGALPAVPWVVYLVGPREPEPAESAIGPARLAEARFWTYWVTEPLGVGSKTHLRGDMDDYLAGPVVAGRPTHLTAAAYAAMLAAAGGAALVAGRRLVRRRWAGWRGVAGWLGGGGSPTDFTVRAALIGYGLALGLMPIYRHYLIAAFPLTFVWLARLCLPATGTPGELKWGRGCLAVLCAAQAVLTGTLLLHLHQHGGGPFPGFGPSYAAQAERGTVTPPPHW